MQRRAGHDEISTTLGYVKMAEDLTASIGKPFPPLPASLIAPTAEPSLVARDQPKDRPNSPPENCTPATSQDNSAERAGFEPGSTRRIGPNRAGSEGVGGSEVAVHPPRNVAKPRGSNGPDDSRDDSHLLALARAALALVAVDTGRTRDLLADLVARLERAAGTKAVVSLVAERARRARS
jgi:hypothetical protein